MAEKWVCTAWEANKEEYLHPHVYDEVTEDFFCPDGPPGDPFHGVLILKPWPPPGPGGPSVSNIFPKDGSEFKKGESIIISADAMVEGGQISRVEFFVDNASIGEDTEPPYTFNYTPTNEGTHTIKVTAYASTGISDSGSVSVKIKPGDDNGVELGLSVIMMDASASMLEMAFEGSPLTRMRLVATSAANGIFDLERMHNNQHAFVAAFAFDDRVKPIFMDSVANLIKKYNGDVKKFATFIYDELFKMQQGTDINLALATAHSFVDKFMKKQLPEFPFKKYNPVRQVILKYKSTVAVAIPNVRVLMYTDGQQFDAHESRILHPNPFVQEPIAGVNHDVLLGAFFGKENDDGCQELQSLLSLCPIHNVKQFFLFDSPDKIGGLKHLFRMASGASGFCPRCLDKELK